MKYKLKPTTRCTFFTGQTSKEGFFMSIFLDSYKLEMSKRTYIRDLFVNPFDFLS